MPAPFMLARYLRDRNKSDQQDARYSFLASAAGNASQSGFAPEPAELWCVALLTSYNYV